MTIENEEVKDSGEELITLENIEEKLGVEKPDKEKETPTVSSTEEKPTEETPEETVEPEKEAGEAEGESVKTETEVGGTVEDEVVEPVDSVKPVDGETPRERALRLEVQRVKEINRGLRGKKLLGDVQPLTAQQSVELSPEDKKALEVFDPEQVSNMEKLLPVLAKKLGFVKKDELHAGTYQSTSQDVLDTWLKDHPDYLPENDKGDVLFNRLKAEISLYQKPANPKDWNKILNRAHNEIMGIKLQPKESVAQVQAKQEKLKVASVGAVSATTSRISDKRKAPTSANNELVNVARSGGLQGFTEEELKEMGL